MPKRTRPPAEPDAADPPRGLIVTVTLELLCQDGLTAIGGNIHAEGDGDLVDLVRAHGEAFKPHVMALVGELGRALGHDDEQITRGWGELPVVAATPRGGTVGRA